VENTKIALVKRVQTTVSHRKRQFAASKAFEDSKETFHEKFL
jgi:hypothetical protein